ncbi:MAG: CvpA family protein [Pikeienuella sp.]
MQLTIADGAVALVVIISAMLAYNRGLTREALAIGGWLLAALASFFFAPFVEPLVQEVPVLGDILRGNCLMSVLAAFAVVFGISLILLSIFTPILSSAVQSTILGPIDKGLGFVFGIARGVLLVGVLYLAYNLIVPTDDRVAMIENSASQGLLSEVADMIMAETPTEAPSWLQTRIDRLMGSCEGGGGSSAFLLPAQPVA